VRLPSTPVATKTGNHEADSMSVFSCLCVFVVAFANLRTAVIGENYDVGSICDGPE